MRRTILQVVFSAVLSVNSIGWAQSSKHASPKEQLSVLAPHSPVEVRFLDGAKLRGRVGEVSNTGFVLTHEMNHQLMNSQLAFDQIKAVRQVRSVKPSHTARNLLIGAGLALAAIGIVFGIGVAVYGLG